MEEKEVEEKEVWRLTAEARARLGTLGKRYIVWRDGEPLQGFDDEFAARVACQRYNGVPPAVFGCVLDLQEEAVIAASLGRMLDPDEAWRIFRLNPRYEAWLTDLYGDLPPVTEDNVLWAPAKWLERWRGMPRLPWPMPAAGATSWVLPENLRAWAKDLVSTRNAKEAGRA